MSYVTYLVESIKLQEVDKTAWVTQIAIVAILLGAFWAPILFN